MRGKEMKNVAIVYCGGLSVAQDKIEAYEHIYNIPTVLIDGEEVLLVNVDIKADEFYEQLKQGKMFRTSLPRLDMLEKLFRKLLKEYKEVVYITMSSALSGTHQSGVLMAQEIDPRRIKVFDSLSAVEGGELFIATAHQMSIEGYSAEKIMDHLETIRGNYKIYFKVEDIDYLVKGGRIGKAVGSVANFLKIQPILTISEDGFIDSYAKVRNTKKMMKKMFAVIDDFNITDKTEFTIIHSYEDLDYIEGVRADLATSYPSIKINVSPLSPIIGTHVGRNVLGISVINY
jgi:DegV family protein with EDD domain